MANPLRKPVPAPEGAGTGGVVVAGERPGGAGARVHDLLHGNATLGPLFVLIVAVVIFSVTADRFLEPRNLSLIVQQVMVVGTLGIAQTLVILTAGIDLSVGAIMVLSSIVMAKLSAEQGMPGLRLRHGVRLPQRGARHAVSAPAVHRDARHPEHLLRAQPLLLQERDGPRG
jgi:fructose transport system permease protein